jgi:hypothetical protein
VTIEESAAWAKHYLQTLASIRWLLGKQADNLVSCMRVLPRTEFLDDSNELVCSYELTSDIQKVKFDLVYIDGPTSWIQSKNFPSAFLRDADKLLPNVSVLELRFKPQIILIDGRRATVSYLVMKGKLKSDRIDLRGSYYLRSRVRPYHTVITS